MATVIDLFTRKTVVACPPGRRRVPVRSGHVVEIHHIAGLRPDLSTGGSPLERFQFAGRQVSRTGRQPDVEGLVALGWLDPGVGHPRLWAFGRAETDGLGDVLFVDDDGGAHVTRSDRRYRCGYRWERIGPLEACWMLRIPVRPLSPTAS
jgi:hypothetical protein